MKGEESEEEEEEGGEEEEGEKQGEKVEDEKQEVNDAIEGFLEEWNPDWDNENKPYKLNRASEYPSIINQLDDIYHNGIDGWKATIKVTKDKYPKE